MPAQVLPVVAPSIITVFLYLVLQLCRKTVHYSAAHIFPKAKGRTEALRAGVPTLHGLRNGMPLCLKPCHERFDQGLWCIHYSDTDPIVYTVVVAEALCEDETIPAAERKKWCVPAAGCVAVNVTCDAPPLPASVGTVACLGLASCCWACCGC